MICSQSHNCQSCSIIAFKLDLVDDGNEKRVNRCEVAVETDDDLDKIEVVLDDIEGDLDGGFVALTNVDVDEDEELLVPLLLIADRLDIVDVVDIPQLTTIFLFAADVDAVVVAVVVAAAAADAVVVVNTPFAVIKCGEQNSRI